MSVCETCANVVKKEGPAHYARSGRSSPASGPKAYTVALRDRLLALPWNSTLGAVRRTSFALILAVCTLGTARLTEASPIGQADDATDEIWLQNHADVTLWSDNTSAAQAFATIPPFLGYFQAQAPFRTEQGRVFVYYPGDITGVQPGYAWVELRSLGPAAAPPTLGLLYRPPPPLGSIDEIFQGIRTPLAEAHAPQLRTLIATGDVIPARVVDSRIRARGNDFLYPVAETADVLRTADLTVINLEAPLIANCPLHETGFTFCGQSGFIEALVHAGVDVATLENNHISNYGPAGIAATKALLTEHGIDHADRWTLAIRDVRGLRFGFLAFNGVGERIDTRTMAGMIGQADAQVDVLVVAIHWGAEYVSIPRVAPGVAPDDPVAVAHLAVEAGADLIIGNHPHWIQAVEVYQGRFIAYAHGNFIFDQPWSLPTRQGVVGRYTFFEDRLVQVEYFPVLIEDAAQPRFLAGEEAQAILDRMYLASQSLAEQIRAGQR